MSKQPNKIPARAGLVPWEDLLASARYLISEGGQERTKAERKREGEAVLKILGQLRDSGNEPVPFVAHLYHFPQLLWRRNSDFCLSTVNRKHVVCARHPPARSAALHHAQLMGDTDD